MNDLITRNLLGRMVSAMTLIAALVLVAKGSLISRWNPFGGVLYCPALLLWIGWLAHFIWMASHRRLLPGVRYRNLRIAGLVFLTLVVASLAYNLGPAVRRCEIQKAVKSGLLQDCNSLLQNWPTDNVCIFPSSPEYEKLPASIRLLNPDYVTNDHDVPEIPPHIGLCKCGFGGFAVGMRVFRSDTEARVFIDQTHCHHERVAEGVYVVWHPT